MAVSSRKGHTFKFLMRRALSLIGPGFLLLKHEKQYFFWLFTFSLKVKIYKG